MGSGTVLTEKGLKATFIAKAKSTPMISAPLCMMVNSTSDKEKHAWLGMPAAVREFKGSRHLKSLAETTYEIKNKLWESSLRIEQTDLDDDSTGGYSQQAMQMGAYFIRHKDELVLGTTLPNGNSTTCIDGQYFYDTDHAWPEADYTTSWDNDITTNITATAAPTTVEFHAALKANWQAAFLAKDDRGKPANLGITGFMLEIPPHYIGVVERFMNSGERGLGADAATNTEYSMWSKLIQGYIVNTYMSNSDRFRMHIVDQPTKPLIFQTREAPVFQMIMAKDKKPDFFSWSEHASFFGVYGRHNAGYGDPTKSSLHIFT